MSFSFVESRMNVFVVTKTFWSPGDMPRRVMLAQLIHNISQDHPQRAFWGLLKEILEKVLYSSMGERCNTSAEGR